MSIIAVVLSSSAVAATITAIVNLYINKRNYRHEYYKQLVSKRFDAFLHVEKIISHFSILDDCSKGIKYAVFSDGIDRYNNMSYDIGMIAMKSMWLNKNIFDAVYEMKLFLTDSGFDKETITKDELSTLGAKHHIKITELKNNIVTTFRANVLSLDKVKNLQEW
jgi:hypothetical protein